MEASLAIQGRYFRPKDKSLSGTQFDSKTEQRVWEALSKGQPDATLSTPTGSCRLKPQSLSYTIQHKYNPDLLLVLPEAPVVLGELAEQPLLKLTLPSSTNGQQPQQSQSPQQPQLASGASEIYVEIKGYFQDAAEASKYLWVRKSLPPDAELVFVFESPSKAMHWLKARKDGTKQTMAEWADKNQFRWFTEESFLEYVNGNS